MKLLHLPILLAAAGFFLGHAPEAAAFPRTKESAELSLTFNLTATPSAPVGATGTASTDVTRENGVETASALELTLTGLVDGTYNVDAILKNDATLTPVAIGTVTVAGTTALSPVTLPAGVEALSIATLTVSAPPAAGVEGATATVLLTGTPTEDIVSWRFFGNRPLRAPEAPALVPAHPGGKVKKVHGHVLIQAKISDNAETRRKFLLVGHGGPAETELTIKLDGVVAGTFTTTKNGKMMVKSLEGDFRLAGVHLVTITNAEGTVIAEADFFPKID